MTERMSEERLAELRRIGDEYGCVDGEDAGELVDEIYRARAEAAHLRAERDRAVELLRMIDPGDAPHPDVTAFFVDLDAAAEVERRKAGAR